MVSLPDSLRDFFSRYDETDTLLLAYSGGLDSHVLLAIAAALQSDYAYQLKAIHVNHQLSPRALDWALHCRLVCDALGVPLIEQSIEIKLQTGDSLEEQARELRYGAFSEHMTEKTVLLTAHHQDDQAETVLLQLCRGAGLKGLSAMPALRSFGKGFHVRPLLGIARETLARYAKAQGLAWVDDESNANTQLSRNFLRHTILPQLKLTWPSIASTLSRSAQHVSEAQTVLDELADSLMPSVVGSEAGLLSVARLLSLTPVKQRLVLRHWIHQRGFPMPHTKKIATIQSDVMNASWDAIPCVAWGGVEVRRFRDDMYLLLAQNEKPDVGDTRWNLQAPLTIEGVGCLSAERQQSMGLSSQVEEVTVRFRQGGEVMAVNGKHCALKNRLQEWGVPTWLRDRIPLLFVNDKLISVVGFFIDEAYRAKPGELGFNIIITR